MHDEKRRQCIKVQNAVLLRVMGLFPLNSTFPMWLFCLHSLKGILSSFS